MGCDFAPDCRPFRVKAMVDFHWEPDPVIVSFLEAFLRDNWLGMDAGLRDVCVSPYTMTRDGFFVLIGFLASQKLLCLLGAPAEPSSLHPSSAGEPAQVPA